jgi:hypothetical protein
MIHDVKHVVNNKLCHIIAAVAVTVFFSFKVRNLSSLVEVRMVPILTISQ